MKIVKGFLLRPTLNLLNWLLKRDGHSVIIGGPLGWEWAKTIDDAHHGIRGPGLHADSHVRQHDHSLAADGSPIALAGVPDLPASKITSGRFGMPRMPDGIANRVLKAAGAGADPAYGLVDHGELTNVSPDQHHARQHDHSLAADGNPIALAGVPDLPASKITSGRFGMPRMPDMALNKVMVGKGAGSNPVEEDKGDFSTQTLVIENRTSDPASPATGRIWLRTNL